MKQGKNRNIKTINLIIIFLTVLFSSISSFAEELPSYYITTQNVDIVQRTLEAGTSFSRRDYEVKDQGTTWRCWAYSGSTVIEEAIQSMLGAKVKISYAHMDYLTLKFGRSLGLGAGFTTYLDYCTAGYGPIEKTGAEWEEPYGENRNEKELSDEEINELSKEEGKYKVNDWRKFSQIYKEIEYDKNGKKTGIKYYLYGHNRINFPSEIPSEVLNARVDEPGIKQKIIDLEREITLLNNNVVSEEYVLKNREAIKKHIKKYGAVTATMYASDSMGTSVNIDEDYHKVIYDTNGQKFYGLGEIDRVNHAITIVGWDDNYAVENFPEEHRPLKPGAYIILNSYRKASWRWRLSIYIV